MKVTRQKSADTTIVAFEGRLDSHTSPAVEAELLNYVEQGDDRFVFDLSRLQYISSSGLRVMLIVAKRLKPIHGTLALCGLQPSVRDVFDIGGFLMIMSVFGTLEEAMAALGQPTSTAMSH